MRFKRSPGYCVSGPGFVYYVMKFFRQHNASYCTAEPVPVVGRPYIISFYEHQEFF